MFYSTEILADKKYALSTVWRAGNTAPGARSTGLRRKAISEVNVERACGTIKKPPGAPIALRLQGTLLYGTARIYQEQCRFVLSDSERIQRAMLKLSGNLKDDKLDDQAGKTKSVQIVLPNDPSFDLDFLQLPPFDFDAPGDTSFLPQTLRASWTNLSTRSHSNSTQLPQLVLDADSSGGRLSYAGGLGYSAASNASLMPGQPTPLAQRSSLAFPDEDDLMVDIGLFVDENGNIVEKDLEQESEPQLPAFPKSKTSTAGTQPNNPKADDQVVPMIVDEDGAIIHPETAAAATTAANPFNTFSPRVAEISSSFLAPSESSSLHKLAQHAANQKPRHRTNYVDEITQIPLREYFRSVTHYAQNMERAVESRDRARSARRANDTTFHRMMAYDLIFGRGIGGIAEVVKTGHIHSEERNGYQHQLAAMFSGEGLAELLCGEKLVKAKRRKLEDERAEAAAATTTAAVPSTPIGSRGQLGRYDDDNQDIERGRQPGSALSDNPSLALNRPSSAVPGSSVPGSAVKHSTGLHNRTRGPSSAGGHSRQNSPNFIERYSDSGLDFGPPMLPSNSVGPFNSPLRSASVAIDYVSSVRVGATGYNSQNKTNTQLGEVMRSTSAFFNLVRDKAATDGVMRTAVNSTGKASKKKSGSLTDTCRWIEFRDIVLPFRHDRPAVVGAFMSLLTLATAHKLRVQQDEETDGGPNDSERYATIIDRDIFIGVLPSPQSDAASKRGSGGSGGRDKNKSKDKLNFKGKGKKRSFQEMDNGPVGGAVAAIDPLTSDGLLMSGHIFPGMMETAVEG